MSIGYPTNTLVLIIGAMVAAAAGSWFGLSTGIGKVPVAPRAARAWRWGTAAVLAAWLLVRLGFSAYPPGGAVLDASVVAAFLAFGMLAGLLPLLISPTFRRIVLAVPGTWLVGLHAIRLGGFLFLALLDMGRLPAEFALPAGYGDMAVGLLALAVVYLLAKRRPHARALAVAWNLVGLLDFVAALTTGVRYIGPFAAQVAAAGVSPLYLNEVLIVPSFGVPLYALLHVYSLFQLSSAGAAQTSQGVDEAAPPPLLRAA
jgi:hypothetical protein